MRGLNKVMLIGNIGRDPEIQYVEAGVAVVKFPLATTETYKDRNGVLVSQTEWHNIEGRIKTRNWEDKDKNKRSSTEITGDNFVMLDKRKEQNETPPEVASVADIPFEAGNTEKDNMPF